MLRILCLAALFPTTQALAAPECVYKDVMTADEISACRNAPDPSVKKSPPPAPRNSKKWTAAQEKEFEARQAAERARQAESLRILNAPEKPQIGMREAQVRETKYFRDWCSPPSPKINRTQTARGVREQWVCTSTYLYFENGALTSVQELGR